MGAPSAESSPPEDSAATEKPPPTPRKSVEVAIAIIFEPSTGEFLICRRKADAVLGGYWEFPGGKCGPGESPAACARRETAEETGLVVEILRPLKIIEHDYPHARVRLHPFICRRASGQVQLLEVAEAKWVPPRTLSDYRFPEANCALVAFLAGGGGIKAAD